VVPVTRNVPFAKTLPCADTKKFKFSVQADPFQYNVEEVAVPLFRTLGILNQYVDVPLVASTCPAVPVALLVSLSSPVTLNLSIVVEARYERPEAVKLPVTVEVPVVAVLAVR
jgi:hypothetical protein